MRRLLLLLFLLFAVSGCSSLHNAYEASNPEPALDLSTCEGKLGNGNNFTYEYEIYQSVRYRGVRATKVNIASVVSGVGYEMVIYDLFERRAVRSLSPQAVRYMQPDVVRIESQFGRLSVPGGTYDVSPEADLTDARGIKAADSGFKSQVSELFRSALHDASVRKSNRDC
jgi:hypothetical protein